MNKNTEVFLTDHCRYFQKERPTCLAEKNWPNTGQTGQNPAKRGQKPAKRGKMPPVFIR